MKGVKRLRVGPYSGYPYRQVRVPPDHPLAWSSQLVGEHRVVLYEKIGPGEHACYHCGARIVWAKSKTPLPVGVSRICVDHLDDDKLNNSPRNLAPSCISCNTRRRAELVVPIARRPHPIAKESTAGLAALPVGGALPAHKIGPLRDVTHEETIALGFANRYVWRYTLSCGHVVDRQGPGRTKCACPEC